MKVEMNRSVVEQVKVKHKASGIILIILFTHVFAVGTVASSSVTEVRVPTIVDTTIGLGDTFDIDVTVVDVTNLYGWDVVLNFNPMVLEAAAVAKPTPNFLGPSTVWAIGLVQPEIDNFMGTVSMGDTFLPPLPTEGVNGSGTLATITFEVKAESAMSALTFEFTDLYTIDVQSGQTVDISHEAINGLFNNMITLLQPVALFDSEPPVAYTSEKVTFNASESKDPDGEIVNYRWDFDDGTVINLANPVATHIYTETGNYTVRLAVTDNNNLTDTATDTIIIGKRNNTIIISMSPTTITVSESTTISGSVIPIRQGIFVTIEYRPTGGKWNTLATITTDTKGQYSYVWTPETADTYEVKASCEGDENALPIESDSQIITVKEALPPDLGIPLGIIAFVAVAVAVVAAGIAVYFLKIRKPMHGVQSSSVDSETCGGSLKMKFLSKIGNKYERSSPQMCVLSVVSKLLNC